MIEEITVSFFFLIFPEKNKSFQMALHLGILELGRNKGFLSETEKPNPFQRVQEKSQKPPVTNSGATKGSE